MIKKLKKTILPLIALSLSTSSLFGTTSNASGSFGAKIYCTMRQNGHGHEASWDAAYESIKSEREGLFKTSPKKAAIQITEEVISGGEEYKNCGQYLGELFGGKQITPQSIIKTSSKGKSNFNKSPELNGSIKKGERYSY